MIIPGLIAAARYRASAGMTELTVGANAFNYTGSKVFRVVPAGVKSLRLKMWGGGGGGGVWGNSGGPGGYLSHTFEVSPGDQVMIQVGGAGEQSKNTAPRNGGAGGWPDGGDGGIYNSLSKACAGGGGSSRVYINGVLVAIAGGGGGGGTDSGGGQGGLGGGDYGTPRTVATYTASGGHSTDGGSFSANAVAANPFGQGSFLRGGRGWATGSRFVSQPNIHSVGSGGGGGYYGGGAGGNGGVGGGAGSGYFSRAIALERTNGFTYGQVSPSNGTRAPAPMTGDPAYPGAPIATGGSATFSNTPTNTAGGHGFVEITAYASAPEPVRVTQQVTEVLSLPLGPVRVTQHTAEVFLTFGASPVRVSQQTIEVIQTRPPAPVRVSQQTVEVIRSLT